MATATYVKERAKGDDSFLYVNDKFITKIFSNKNNKDYILRVLKGVFKEANIYPIDDFEFVDIRISKKSTSVDSISDIVLESDEILINLEVNKAKYRSTKTDNKNFSYICWLILRQLPSGSAPKAYSDIKPIVQINLNSFDQFKKGEFIYVSKHLETKYHIPRSNLFTIIDINLDFFKTLEYNEIKKFSDNSLEKSLYLWTCNETDKLNDIYEGDEMVKRVLGQLYEFAENGDEYLFYDKEELERQVSYDDGVVDGEAKGFEKGKKEGSLREKEKIAEKMLVKGRPLKEVSEMTELPEDELIKFASRLSEK